MRNSTGKGRRGGRGRRQGLRQRCADDRGKKNVQWLDQSEYFPPPPTPHSRIDKSNDVESFAKGIENQIRSLKDRISEIEQSKNETSTSSSNAFGETTNQGTHPHKETARVDKEKCCCCGLCIDVCREQAITMNEVVVIDSSRCTACGACIDECPNEAISLSSPASAVLHQRTLP